MEQTNVTRKQPGQVVVCPEFVRLTLLCKCVSLMSELDPETLTQPSVSHLQNRFLLVPCRVATPTARWHACCWVVERVTWTSKRDARPFMRLVQHADATLARTPVAASAQVLHTTDPLSGPEYDCPCWPTPDVEGNEGTQDTPGRMPARRATTLHGQNHWMVALTLLNDGPG